MTDEPECTVCMKLNPLKAEALYLALEDNEKALGALSYKLEQDYNPKASQFTEEYREASEALLEVLKEELMVVSNGERVLEESKLDL